MAVGLAAWTVGAAEGPGVGGPGCPPRPQQDRFFFFFTLKKGHQTLRARARPGLFPPFSLSRAKVRRARLGCESSRDREPQAAGFL